MQPLPIIQRLLTHKNDPAHSRVEQIDGPADLQPGEVLFRLHRYALTTNNITYAVFGDAMRYWDFFPTGDPEWGQMPVWGYGDVVASRAEGIEAGERFYGYFPIASHLKVEAAAVKPQGFMDGAEHRKGLSPIYNYYSRCSADDSPMPPAFDGAQLIVRPLFTTAFLCADFLQTQDFFGAQQIVLSSASSKTAYATAHCLKGGAAVQRVGLTSAANRSFVESTGVYDRVVGYDELDQLANNVPTLYLDFAGSVPLRAAVRERLGASLVYDCVVGATQNSPASQGTRWPDPRPAFFFAPDQGQKRMAEWGAAMFRERLGHAQIAFLEAVSAGNPPTLQLVQGAGLEAAAQVIADLVAGRVDPRQGHVLSVSAG
ncbi:MAG: DUF2855 family protein [Hydrogenophaga sp.]